MNPVIRVVVTGGRGYNDVEAIDRELSRVVRSARERKIVIINGGAPGLDSLVEKWCLEKGVPCITMKAPWASHYGRRAGPIRNQWMIDFALPTYAIVFPGGNGTADMHARIKAAGISHHVVT